MSTADELAALRNEIDEIDRGIVELLARRLDVCRRVADVKSRGATSIIQPERVRQVLTSRRQWAIDRGIDADFAEQIFRTLLAETHRIEVALERPEAAPVKAAVAPPPDAATESSNRQAQAEKVLGIDKVAKPNELPKSPFSTKNDDLLKDLK